jgi:hypothetical protein
MGSLWRSTPRPQVLPTSEDVAWATGFLEGEGCFSFSGGGTAQVSVVQNQKEPLEKLQRFFGGRIYEPYTTRRFYQWKVHGVLATRVMGLVYYGLSEDKKTDVDSVYSEVDAYHAR